ncbi:MAG: insulinase family protein [Muribaculaceae bacterium]|nr:insulinase family protein [Muribaculaceae bacterium]
MKSRRLSPTVTELSGGLRLVHVHDRSTAAAIFGISVRAGSADESADAFGLAHFVEHTIFKGTLKRSSWHIINRMEAVGGELNAYTTKEMTVVYTIFPAGATSRAVELVADLAVNSQFPTRELDKEREVVVDEINSYLDSPSEAVYDDFEDLFYEGGLGHNILGTPESVGRLDSEACRGFLARHYRAGNMVAFYSGPVGAERVGRAVERYFAGLPQGRAEAGTQPSRVRGRFEHERCLPIHQSHVVLGAEVAGMESAGRYAAAMFANITGGPGMNSLLNVELRERRGLVYSVEASTTFFSGTGLLNVYYGCDAEDRERCLRLCRKVFGELADGIDARRLERARKQYLGQLALAGENRENRILGAARSTLFLGAPPSDAEVEEAIRAVSAADISAVAASMLDASVLSFIPESSHT